jgi:dihydrofolate reductase
LDIKRYIFGPFNNAKKYVVSYETVDLTSKESILISDDVVARIKALKVEEGPRLQVHGSGMLVQTFLKNDLVDELRLRIFLLRLELESVYLQREQSLPHLS